MLQEWFIYHTLFGEPWLLNFLELAVLLFASVVEGVVIAFVLAREACDRFPTGARMKASADLMGSEYVATTRDPVSVNSFWA